MTDVLFRCPDCGRHLAIDEQGAGMVVDCPHCERSIQVPHPAVYLNCPHCETALAVPSGLGSSAVKCPNCAQEIEQPQLLGKAQPPPSEDAADQGQKDTAPPAAPIVHAQQDTIYRTKSMKPDTGSAAPVRQGGDQKQPRTKSPLDDTITVIVGIVIITATIIALFILFRQTHEPLFEETLDTPRRSRSPKIGRAADTLDPAHVGRGQSTTTAPITHAETRAEFLLSLDVFTTIMNRLQQDVSHGSTYSSFRETLHALYDAYDSMPNPPQSEVALTAWFRRFDAEANTALFYYEAAEKSWRVFVETEGEDYSADFLKTNENRMRSFVWNRADEAAKACLLVYEELKEREIAD